MKKGVKLTTLALAVFSGLFFFAPAEANAEQNMLMQSANQAKKVTGQSPLFPHFQAEKYIKKTIQMNG